MQKFTVPSSVSASAWINPEKYRSMYAQSVNEPEIFWAEQGRYLD